MSGFQVLEKHGVEKNAFIPSFAKLSLFFLFVYVSSFTAIADAATYYVSPSGSGTTCSSGSPCTLATGLGKSLVGDDYLYLQDGTYFGTSLTVPWSGTSGHPITIKAVNDGQAIIDGQNVRIPLTIASRNDITVEGIVFKNSSASVAYVRTSSMRITLRRVSAYNANAGDNNHVYEVTTSSYVLLEDCAASGSGRSMYNIWQSNHVMLRRCWGLWTRHDADWGPASITSIYDTNNSTIENVIGTYVSGATYTNAMNGIGSVAPSVALNNNKWYGNVAYGVPDSAFKVETNIATTGNTWKDCVAINGGGGSVGFKQEGDTNLSMTNNTSVNIAGWHYYMLPTEDAGATVKNNSFITNGTGLYACPAQRYVITHRYNNLYGLLTNYGCTLTSDPTETNTNPNYNTSTYGKGAYLMVPPALQGQGESGADIGAEVIYRYVDGVITSAHLWPWPMENRILAETGISVTYESGGGIWGGTWEATKDWDQIYGGSSDATPPAAPQGLLVQ